LMTETDQFSKRRVSYKYQTMDKVQKRHSSKINYHRQNLYNRSVKKKVNKVTNSVQVNKLSNESQRVKCLTLHLYTGAGGAVTMLHVTVSHYNGHCLLTL
jgi:hypothetical protein